MTNLIRAAALLLALGTLAAGAPPGNAMPMKLTPQQIAALQKSLAAQLQVATIQSRATRDPRAKAILAEQMRKIQEIMQDITVNKAKAASKSFNSFRNYF